jgi:RNA polymerase sigma factor (sigma-70 family)
MACVDVVGRGVAPTNSLQPSRLPTTIGGMSDVTRILSQIESGDPAAAAKLLPLVYDELRKLAAARLARERPGQTLQATALVHEAYLRLVGRQEAGQSAHSPGTSNCESSPVADCPKPSSFSSKGHFFAAAAEAMRRILVENARRKQAQKRGSNSIRHDVLDMEIAADEIPEDLITLDQALAELAAIDKPAADLVHLRYFAGLSIPDAADALGVSPRTASRLWSYARAWLRLRVEGNAPDNS